MLKLNILSLSIFLLFIAIITMRPSIFGETSGLLSILCLYASFTLTLLYSKYIKQKKLKLSCSWKDNKNILILFLSYNIVVFFNNFILQSIGSTSLEKQLITNFLLIFPLFFILSFDYINKKISYIFYVTIILVSISTVLSFFLFAVLNFSQIYFQYQYRLGSVAGIFFPFTPLMMSGTERIYGSISFYRSLNIFREPGISQAFLGWAFIVTSSFQFKKITELCIRIILFFAIFLTFSTTAFITFSVILTYILVIEPIFIKNSEYIKLSKNKLFRVNLWLRVSKIIFTISLFYIVVFYILDGNSAFSNLMLYNTNYNLERKMDPESGSYQSYRDREIQTQRSINLFLNDPLLIGERPITSEEEEGSINLLAKLDIIGLQGLLVLIFMYIAFFNKGYSVKHKIFYMFTFLPIILTAISTQPIIDSPLVITLLLFDYTVPT